MRFPKPFLALLLSSWLCHIQGNDNYFHSHEKPTNSNIGKLSHNPFEIYNTNYSEHQHSQLSRAGTNEKHYVRLENGTYSEDGIGNIKFSLSLVFYANGQCIIGAYTIRFLTRRVFLPGVVSSGCL